GGAAPAAPWNNGAAGEPGGAHAPHQARGGRGGGGAGPPPRRSTHPDQGTEPMLILMSSAVSSLGRIPEGAAGSRRERLRLRRGEGGRAGEEREQLAGEGPLQAGIEKVPLLAGRPAAAGAAGGGRGGR